MLSVVGGLRIVAVVLAATSASGKLMNGSYTGVCYDQKPYLGTAEFCCDGTCTDGSQINRPGSCQNFTNACLDTPTPPKCSTTQGLIWDFPTSTSFVPSGRGQCTSSASCLWKRTNHTWSCCDCFPGFVSTNKGMCDPLGLEGPSPPCIGCSSVHEQLKKDSKGQYYCDLLTAHCRMNAAGIAMLKSYEHFCPSFYNDGTGHKAIGWGHDCCANDDCSTLPNPMTQAQADNLLDCDLRGAERSIAKIAGSDTMNANQFAAFVDFAFNAGPKWFPQLFAAEISQRSWSDICQSIKTLNGYGTAKRHLDQYNLCMTATNYVSGCPAASSKRDEMSLESEFLERDDGEEAQANLEVRATDPLCNAWTGPKAANCVGACKKCAHLTDSGKHPNKCVL